MIFLNVSDSKNHFPLTDIGFNFVLSRNTFTQFSVSTNGYIKLGGYPIIGTSQYGYNYTYILAQSSNTNILSPFGFNITTTGITATCGSH